jgi:hypothetical protein
MAWCDFISGLWSLKLQLAKKGKWARLNFLHPADKPPVAAKRRKAADDEPKWTTLFRAPVKKAGKGGQGGQRRTNLPFRPQKHLDSASSVRLRPDLEFRLPCPPLHEVRRRKPVLIPDHTLRRVAAHKKANKGDFFRMMPKKGGTRTPFSQPETPFSRPLCLSYRLHGL